MERHLRPLLAIKQFLCSYRDSRIGLVRGEEYKQLTSDHSLVNALLKLVRITAEEAERHPNEISLPNLSDKRGNSNDFE